jgi:hypothetical protein
VNFAAKTHLGVVVGLPTPHGDYLYVRGPFDTGAQLSFLKENILRQYLPDYLKVLRLCPYLIWSTGGDPVRVLGQIELDCQVEGRPVRHTLVVGCITEDVLLGLDFIARYRASWNWKIDRMEFHADKSD